MRALKTIMIALFVLTGTMTATAIAANAADMPDASGIVDMLKPIYEAFVHGQKLYAGMLALVLAVALMRRYAPDWKGVRAFIHGDTGGALTTLLMSFGTSMAASLAGGAGASWLMVKSASMIAFGAAGGYTLVKRIIVDPILRPLAAKAPAWAQPIFALVFWIFDKDTPVAAAQAAGQAAVDAQPPTGTNGVVGKSTEVS